MHADGWADVTRIGGRRCRKPCFALRRVGASVSRSAGPRTRGQQWAASTGCDAQPYFRTFNPVAQSQRFDAEGQFIRRYLPILARMPAELIHAPWLARPVDLAAAGVEVGRDYPAPIVDHDAARAKTLARYAAVKGPRQAWRLIAANVGSWRGR
jgi:hypothetical protein